MNWFTKLFKLPDYRIVKVTRQGKITYAVEKAKPVYDGPEGTGTRVQWVFLDSFDSQAAARLYVNSRLKKNVNKTEVVERFWL